MIERMKLCSIQSSIVLIAVFMASCTVPAEKSESTDQQQGLNISLKDEKGQPTNARVYISSGDSLYVPATGVLFYRGDDRPYWQEKGLCLFSHVLFMGKDSTTRQNYQAGQHFTTLGHGFQIQLPEGNYRIRIEKGKEYLPVYDSIIIKKGKPESKSYTLERWTDMNAGGWYSGDMHVHRSPDELESLLQAEDLNVAVPQTIWNFKHPGNWGKWLPRADQNGTVYTGPAHCFPLVSHEMERKSALLVHNTGLDTIALFNQGIGKYGPTNEALMQRGKELGGIVDLEKAVWPESHLFIATGMVDLVGILNNHIVIDIGHLPEDGWILGRQGFGSVYEDNEKGYTRYIFDSYYSFLNAGFRLMLSAGSASGVLPNPLGYNRVYVHLDGPFSLKAWMENLKAGHSFVSNGPMLMAEFNGMLPGHEAELQKGEKLNINIEVLYPEAIESVEIIRDGEVAERISPVKMTEGKTVVETSLPFEHTGWVAVRCRGEGEENLQMAHTAPFFVRVPGTELKPNEEQLNYYLQLSEMLIKEAENIPITPDDPRGFRSKEEKEAWLENYRKGKAVWTGLIENH